MKRAKAKIKLGMTFADTKITIDGKELPNITEVIIESSPELITVATVKFIPDSVEGEMFVDPNVEFIEKKENENSKK